MNAPSHKESLKIKKLADAYNMFVNLFWSGLNLTPVAIFCYAYMNLKVFFIFIALSTPVIFLPKSFFNKVQLAKTGTLYKKLGVGFFNRFTQNGDIVNALIRKKYPGYRVVSPKIKSVNGLLNQTYMFEKFHYFLLIFCTLTIIFCVLNHYLWWCIIIFVTNIIYNIYPVFLQQSIRIRLGSFKSKIQ